MKVMDQLNMPTRGETFEDRQKFQKIIDEYRERVLGESCLQYAPPEYWANRLALEINLTPSQWVEIPLDDRAKIMAQHYLSDMIKTIDRHFEEQKANRKKNAQELEERRKKNSRRAS